MGPARILILAVALTAAIGAALIVRNMAQGRPAPAPAARTVERPMTDVLVAKRDLTPGTVLVEEDMAWQAWPKESVNALFITKVGAPTAEGAGPVAKAAGQAAQATKEAVSGTPMAALVGAVVREEMVAGEPMTARKLVRAGSAGIMAVTLEPGARAIAVPLSAESAAGGFILPGDHVDVVQSRETETPGGTRYVAGTVLRNVKVLAVDQAIGAKEPAVVGATATLQVSPQQAEMLVLAKSQGELTLVLRSYADTAGPTVTVAEDAPEEAAFESAVVRVYRNTQPTDVTVAR